MRLMRMLKVALVCGALGLAQTAYAEVMVTPAVPDSKDVAIPVIHTASAPAARVPAGAQAAPAPAAQPAPVVIQPPAPAPGHHGGCCPTECAPTKKICVSEVEKRPHTEVKYRCKCKTICLTNCALCGKKK